MICRRDALRFGSIALVGTSVLPSLIGKMLRNSEPSSRLFFDKSDIPRIRANARTVLLSAQYHKWAVNSPKAVGFAWEKFERSGNIIYDLRDFWAVFTETALVYIVEPTPDRKRVLLDAFEKIVRLPKWDYLMDGDEDIGLMRAGMAVSRLLFAREALGDDFSDELNERFLIALAEKGAAPCFRTICGMNEPNQVVGWRYDPSHPKINDYSLAHWPKILGENNLRGAATLGLGLGALALVGRDPRAKKWLETAVESAFSTFGQFTEGGSYSEGVSYGGYAMRLLLQFCEAHYRIDGSVDWTNALNWSGFVDDVVAMQAGEKPDGTPDVVNFSDASGSIYPCVGSWIRIRTGNPVGQYVTNRFSDPGYFLDFLWYRSSFSSALPARNLKNYRSDLDWVICRSGWQADDAVLAFRSGNPANHEHADRNSFLYKIYGERLLSDHTGAAYERKDPKWTLRLTKAHNAVLIGGRGHQYHEGEEGVNAGQAKAKVISFVERGNRVCWTSDATQAYQLTNENVSKVLRTVVFAKPNIIVLLDCVDLKTNAEDVEIRFFPDNRDNKAKLTTEWSHFSIVRPRATLFGAFASKVSHFVNTEKLDFSEDLLPGEELNDTEKIGDFPFVRARSASALQHEIVTVMVAQAGTGMLAPKIGISKTVDGWRFDTLGVKGILNTTAHIPKLDWIDEI
ncbi:heparinase II/III-family protein [Puniceicoccaceae bacterium K14]|nr:heparinase II/III-family protein [Puniceicoccaceae bacterium K14]